VKRKLALVLVLAFVAAALSGAEGGGCVTTSQGNKLQAEVDDLRARLVALERAQADLKTAFDATTASRGELFSNVQAVQGDLQELRGTVEETAFQVDRLKKTVGETRPELDQLLSDLQTRLAAIEAKLGMEPGQQAIPPIPGDSGKPAPTAPGKGQTDKELYDTAYGAFQGRQFESSRQLFRSLLKSFPKSKLAGNAQYWIAETYYNQRDYENAILEYDKVVSQYPSSGKVAAAYLKMGFAFFEINEKKDARAFFERVVQDFPNSPEAALAKKKLATMK
jgi:tol-pal system protein YbgF